MIALLSGSADNQRKWRSVANRAQRGLNCATIRRLFVARLTDAKPLAISDIPFLGSPRPNRPRGRRLFFANFFKLLVPLILGETRSVTVLWSAIVLEISGCVHNAVQCFLCSALDVFTTGRGQRIASPLRAGLPVPPPLRLSDTTLSPINNSRLPAGPPLKSYVASLDCSPLWPHVVDGSKGGAHGSGSAETPSKTSKTLGWDRDRCQRVVLCAKGSVGDSSVTFALFVSEPELDRLQGLQTRLVLVKP